MVAPDLTQETQAIVRSAAALVEGKPRANDCRRFILAVAYIDAARECGMSEAEMLDEIVVYAEAVEDAGGVAEASLT